MGLRRRKRAADGKENGEQGKQGKGFGENRERVEQGEEVSGRTNRDGGSFHLGAKGKKTEQKNGAEKIEEKAAATNRNREGKLRQNEG